MIIPYYVSFKMSASQSCKKHNILIVEHAHEQYDQFRNLLLYGFTDKQIGCDLNNKLSELYELHNATDNKTCIEKLEISISNCNPYKVILINIKDSIEVVMNIWHCAPKTQVILFLTPENKGDYNKINFSSHYNDLLILKKPYEPIEILQNINAMCHKWDLNNDSVQYIKRLENIKIEALNINNDLEVAIEKVYLDIEEATLATESKTEFLKNMSHEIRTPMTAIMGFSDAILHSDEVNDLPENCQNAVNTIHRNSEHLLQIINDILDMSKIESGEIEVDCFTCSSVEILSDVRSIIDIRARVKKLDFSIKIHYPIPAMVNTDPTRVRQILINLLGNSVKFTELGSIALSIRYVADGDSGPMLQFDVEDTGIGLSADQMKSLFQPFVQAEASTARNYGGTGLGLSIAKQLAEMLGGGIEVSSVEGKGSKFTVSIATDMPLDCKMLNCEEEVTALDDSNNKSDKVLLSGNVMLVDDCEDNRLLISHLLKQTGLNVEVAENGKIGLIKALKRMNKGNAFDLILMDMQMPVMDGYKATSELRRKGYVNPIVALTAHAMSSDCLNCLESGCDEYLTKPIDRSKFFSVIGMYLQQVTALESREVEGESFEEQLRVATDRVGNKKKAISTKIVYSEMHDDESFGDLLDSFVAKLSTRLDKMREGIDVGDSVCVEEGAHQLKGTSGNYGFPTILESAKALEVAAKEGNWTVISEVFAKLTLLCNGAMAGRNITPEVSEAPEALEEISSLASPQGG